MYTCSVTAERCLPVLSFIPAHFLDITLILYSVIVTSWLFELNVKSSVFNNEEDLSVLHYNSFMVTANAAPILLLMLLDASVVYFYSLI